MKELILKYLQEADKGVPAAQILVDVLKIRSPNAHYSESILAGLLGQDPRFVFTAGLWHLRLPSVSSPDWDDSRIVVLHLQTADNSATLRHFRGAARWADRHLKEFASPAPVRILSRLERFEPLKAVGGVTPVSNADSRGQKPMRRFRSPQGPALRAGRFSAAALRQANRSRQAA